MNSATPRTRSVSAEVELDVREEAELVWSVAVAQHPDHGPQLSSERLEVTVDGSPVALEELRVDDGGRLHVCTARPGRLRLSYAAEVTGSAPPANIGVRTIERASWAGVNVPSKMTPLVWTARS